MLHCSRIVQQMKKERIPQIDVKNCLFSNPAIIDTHLTFFRPSENIHFWPIRLTLYIFLHFFLLVCCPVSATWCWMRSTRGTSSRMCCSSLWRIYSASGTTSKSSSWVPHSTQRSFPHTLVLNSPKCFHQICCSFIGLDIPPSHSPCFFCLMPSRQLSNNPYSWFDVPSGRVSTWGRCRDDQVDQRYSQTHTYKNSHTLHTCINTYTYPTPTSFLFYFSFKISKLMSVCQVSSPESGPSSLVEERLLAGAPLQTGEGGERSWIQGELALLCSHTAGQVSCENSWVVKLAEPLPGY